MKKISIMLIAALVAASAQAITITFDEPGHVHGGHINGINGWVETYGARTFNTLDVGGRGNVLWLDSGKAYKDVTGDMANVTTASFLLTSYNAQIGEFALTVGGVDPANGENIDAVMWLWIDGSDEAAGVNDHNLVVNSGAGGSVAFDYIRGENYRFTAVLDFSQQKIISVTLEDLTGSLGTQTGSNVDFYTAKTLAEAQTSTSVLLGGNGSFRSGYDNITVESSVQVDFEEPVYVATVTSSSVAGQKGWKVYSGEGNVVSNTPSVLQSGDQELGVRKDSYVYKHFSGANFVDNHTLKYKVGRTGDVNANIYLGKGTGGGNSIVHLYHGFGGGFYAYDGSTFTNVWDEFDANDVYEVSVDVDFVASEYDIVVSNLTDGTSGSLAGLAFENAIAADEFTNNATLWFTPSYDTLWIDDIELNGQLDDFEEPVFYTEATTSFTDVGGQDDWVVFSGQAYVYSNSPSILGSGDQELGVPSGASVYRNSVGSMLDTNTTCIFKVGRTAAMTGQMRLGAGGSDTNAIVHIDFDSANGIGVYDGGTGSYVNVWSEFDSNKVYRVKTEIDFATQTYDITIDNLTDSTSASLATIGFEHAKTLADFAVAQATLRFEAQTSTLWVDDVFLYGPIPLADSDGDGLPNFWELDYYGHITDNVTSNDIVANGINTALEAYIAGFVPIDSRAFFGITDISEDAGDFVLQWNRTSGREYSVYWAPNLMLGFSLLQDNISGGSYTDMVNSAGSKGFYKLDVELAP